MYARIHTNSVEISSVIYQVEFFTICEVKNKGNFKNNNYFSISSVGNCDDVDGLMIMAGIDMSDWISTRDTIGFTKKA